MPSAERSTRITRRGFLVGTAAVLASGCIRTPQNQEYAPITPVRPGGPETIGGDSGLFYTVERGDTLAAISRRAGIPVADIKEANRLSSDRLQPGTRLWLPGAIAIIGATPVTKPSAPEAVSDGEPYRLVPRSSWTDAKIGPKREAMGKVLKITVHHTDETPGLAGVPDAELLKRIDNYHRSGRHWPSIGYHYLVGRDDGICNIYEGRPAHFKGTHTLHNNSNNLGIAVMGDFMHKLPTPKQLRALRAFLDDSRSRFGLSLTQVYGHRELSASSCPGDALFAWLKDYRTGRAG